MRQVRTFLIILFFLLQIKVINSQVQQEWNTRYYFSNSDEGFRYIAIDNSGNIIVSGIVLSNIGDYLIIKYNSSGVQQWIATYNGPANNEEIPFAMTVDDSNNIYITGWSRGSGTNYDYATVKYDSSGVQKWVARYNGTGNGSDKANAITVDSFQNIYVTGQSLTDVTNFGGDIVTVKYNSIGVQQWVKSYSGTAHLSSDLGNAITMDKSNNVYVTGSCVDSVDEPSFCTIKYTSEGNQVWVARYNGTIKRSDEGCFIKVDNNENVFVSGVSYNEMQYIDFATVKYNSQGIEQWSRKYDGSGHFQDRVWGMAIDNIGNVYVTGSSTETGTGYDYTTIKYNTIGDQIWLRRYNNGLNDIPRDITLDDSGNIYLTGESDGNGTDDDMATVKYDSSGNQIWAIRYNYSGQSVDESRAMALDNLGNVYITGYSNRDFLTIKYSQTITGIMPISSEVSTDFNLEQNFPNPFNPNTVICYQLPTSCFTTLRVYSILGDEVKTLVNKEQNTGSYEIEFVGDGLPSGIYFYSLDVNGSTIDTKRMILLK